MNTETLNLEEAAKFLCMSSSSLRQKTKNGEINGSKIAKRWVYLKQDLVEHIRSKYTNLVEISSSDSNSIYKETLCQYTKEVKPTGLVSQRQTDREYAARLGLKTKT